MWHDEHYIVIIIIIIITMNITSLSLPSLKFTIFLNVLPHTLSTWLLLLVEAGRVSYMNQVNGLACHEFSFTLVDIVRTSQDRTSWRRLRVD